MSTTKERIAERRAAAAKDAIAEVAYLTAALKAVEGCDKEEWKAYHGATTKSLKERLAHAQIVAAGQPLYKYSVDFEDDNGDETFHNNVTFTGGNAEEVAAFINGSIQAWMDENDEWVDDESDDETLNVSASQIDAHFDKKKSDYVLNYGDECVNSLQITVSRNSLN